MRRGFILIIFFVEYITFVCAQGTSSLSLVDTLSVRDRIALRTNAVDWLLLTPNIGIEYSLGNTNWNRWTIGVNVKGNPETSHTFNPGTVYNLMDIRTEVRNYWRTRDMSDPDNKQVPAHKNILQKLISQRRKQALHPKTVYFRGFYAGYTKYSILLGHEGKQGSALQAGMLYGIERPLYVYTNGNSIDMELGISIGACYTQYQKYRHENEDDCYPVIGTETWHLIKHPVISDIHAGLVYRFGKYPLQKRYQWRYNIDTQYQAAMDSINLLRYKKRFERNYMDSIYNAVFNDFEHIYDSISKANHVHPDSINLVRNSSKQAMTSKKRLHTLKAGKNDTPQKENTVKEKEKKARKEETAEDKKKAKDQKEDKEGKDEK